MENKEKSKSVNVLRWILFLPAAIVGSWLVYVIFRFLNVHDMYHGSSIVSWVSIVTLFADYIHGLAFVFIGAIVAPSSRKVVSIVMLCLMCMFSAISIFLNIANGIDWIVLIGTLLTLGGAIHGVYLISDNYNEN